MSQILNLNTYVFAHGQLLAQLFLSHLIQSPILFSKCFKKFRDCAAYKDRLGHSNVALQGVRLTF